jgi:acetyltransferase-like isoleucine patch superfamily enzyme
MRFLDRALLGLATFFPIPFVKTSLYRMSGARIGRNVYFSPNVVLHCTNMKLSRIENNCSLGLGAWISCKSIEMLDGVKIAGGACIVGKERVALGNGVYIGHNALLDCWDAIVLEDHVQVGPGAMILTHDSSGHYIRGEKILSGPSTIRENAYIGAGAIVLPGIEIGRCAIVAAGAVVTKNVPPGSTVVGCPARPRATLQTGQEVK